MDDEYEDDHEKEYRNISSHKQRIYQYIRSNPGIHLRRIAKDLKLGMGNASYCLGLLETEGSIKSRRIRLYKTYYTVSSLAEKDEFLLAALQQETPRDIISYLIEKPGATQTDIAHLKSFTSSTINWHMSRLIEVGLVYSQKDGRFIRYYLKGDINDILSLMKSYHTSIWNRLSERLAHLFLSVSEGSPSQSKILQ